MFVFFNNYISTANETFIPFRVFSNVNFSYNKSEQVLHNISFNIKKGEKVAIVGATGAGKSTIINLLTRFYEIQKGSIKINGFEIRDLELNFLRSKIALVLQDVFLFADTLLNKNMSKKGNMLEQQEQEQHNTQRQNQENTTVPPPPPQSNENIAPPLPKKTMQQN